MTAFDHLERQLRGGVRRGHRPTRRLWSRPPLLAAAAALVIGASALAANGTIRIGNAHEDPGVPKPAPHALAGVRASATKTLPLRVPDPAGGPPWTLRAFDSSRGGHCIQVGQVVRGHFGVLVAGVLEPLRAWPGGGTSTCGAQVQNGFPIVRGLQHIRTVGGSGDPHRCPRRPNRDCPISSVTVLRYGLLGPAARNVRLIDARGSTVATSATSARTGGAYLFAVAQPTAPYAAAEQAQRAEGAAIQRAMKAARRRGASPDQAYLEAVRSNPPGSRGVNVRPPDYRVIATFANGRTLQVAGRGRTQAQLPGVRDAGPAQPAGLPRDVTVSTHITRPGRFATVTLAFKAPLAITRFDIHYTATLHGHTGKRCNQQTGGTNATTRDIAAGQTVRFVLRRPRGAYENGRQGWCPGRFTGEIRYSTPEHATTIGNYTFTIP